MAIDKPTKPTDLMPEEFALSGVKNNFSSSKIASGFSANFEDILQGDNLNYMLDSIGKQLNYLNTIADFINGMSIGKTITVNANNKLDYNNLVSDVSDRANIDLSNITTSGQSKLQPIGQPQFTLDFNNLPANCIWLEGAEVSRATYANLFAIFGTAYGEGDGATTFNLPDCRNRVLWGGSEAGYIAAGLPNITGSFKTGGGAPLEWGNGAFTVGSPTSSYAQNWYGSPSGTAYFDASRSNSIYGNSVTVQPPSIKVRVYTRYQ